VCQKQIAVPNNSLLYCSEKCKREDAQPSSSPPFSHRLSSTDLRSSSSSLKLSTFEPSRKEQWGIPPSPTREFASAGHQDYSGTSPGNPRPPFERWGPSTRPLPPLHARAALSSSPRSMELVLPVYRGDAASPNVEGLSSERKSLDYGRRMVEGNAASTGGLKKLFHFKELQMSPTTS
jgi:ECL1/2/3 zinc binding proteins